MTFVRGVPTCGELADLWGGSAQMKLHREKTKGQMKMKMESAGHFLDGFGIFGPSRIHSRSFKTQILLSYYRASNSALPKPSVSLHQITVPQIR